jgi:acetyl-CoA/propionyl-CoA carboxylase biotin carboxyl carrier protein
VHGRAHRVGGTTRSLRWARERDVLHLAVDGVTQSFATARTRGGTGAAAAHDPELRSPMPGTVVAVVAEQGVAVTQGEPVLVVEAMKMEHVVQASTAGVVDLRVGLGDRVERGDLLAVVRAVPDRVASDEAETRAVG